MSGRILPARRTCRPLVLVAGMIALTTVFLPALPARAAEDPRVEVQVDNPRPAADEFVRLTYTIQGLGSLSSVRPPSPLPLKNLQVAGGPSTSTQIVFMNGELRKSVSLTWVLRPSGAGPAEVGETMWTVGDRTVKCSPYLLAVGPPRRAAGGGSAVVPPENEDPFVSRFRGLEPSRGPARQREGVAAYVVTPDKRSAYVGEEILLTYDLVVAGVDVLNLEPVDPPKFPGFWAEDVERPEKPKGRPDTYEGRRVVRFTLLKKAVAGLTPGSFTIPPARVRLAVRLGGDPFADPFAMLRPQVVDRSTPPLALKILPIPGRETFKGPVGRFNLTASVDRERVTAGEAFTVRISAAGTGSLRTAADAPRLEIPAARVYPPTAKTGSSRTGGRPSANAEWDYVVVPVGPGPLVVPAVSMEVFDPAERRIATRSTKAITVLVSPAAAAPAAGTSLPGTAATTLSPAEASAPVKAPVTAAKPSATPLAVDLARGTVTVPVWVFAAALGGLLAGGGAIVFARRRRRGTPDGDDALSAEPGETKERAAARLDRRLRVLASAHFGVPEGLPNSRLLAALGEAGLLPETVEEVKRLLEEIDFLRFAPQLGEYGERIEAAREAAGNLFARLS